MRALSFLLVSSFLIGENLSGQSRFGAGVIAGVATTQIGGDGYAGFDKIGPLIGGFVNTNIKKKWEGQFEITYINKGSKDPARPKIGKYEFRRINLHYVEIPLLLKYHIQKRNFQLQLGMTYARLVGERHTNNFGEILPVINGVKKDELGFLLGGSWKFMNTLTLNARFTSSILPIAGSIELHPYWLGLVGGAYNTGLLFTLSHQFPLNSKEVEKE